MKPTEQQQAVIDTQTGNVAVKACPGSGKTATLVARCQALPPSESKLVLAFNKKAADTFSQRLGSAPICDVRTFHSFCLREVFQNWEQMGFSAKPNLDTDLTLYKSIKTFVAPEMRGWKDLPVDQATIEELNGHYYTDELEDMAKELVYLNSRKIEFADLLRARVQERNQAEVNSLQAQLDAIKEKTMKPIAADMVLKIRRGLIDSNTITFASMIGLVAEHCRGGLVPFAGQHIMVDEFQDVDRFQFDIVAAMAKHKEVKSVVCVGDPNQRIYEWRGALTNAFSTMQNTLEDVKILPVTVNFRSKKSIIEKAETICPVGMSGTNPEPGVVTAVKGDAFKQLTESANLSDCAILCRYNKECFQWQLDLAKEGTPVFVIGGGSFWRTPHVKLAMDARKRNMSLSELTETKEWKKFMAAPRFEDNPDAVEEVESDAEFVLNSSSADLLVLQKNLQNPNGITIATIHKTKGMEWDRVLISGVTEKLKEETFVWYVAVTRAKSFLLLG